MKRKTRNYTIAAIITLIILIIVVYSHFNFLYNEYGNLGLIGGMFLYTFIFGAILYAYLWFKFPRRRRYVQPYYEDRVVDVYHHYDDRPRYPRRSPYEQNVISPMFQKQAERASSHQYDVIDNYGYFGKKRHRR